MKRGLAAFLMLLATPAFAAILPKKFSYHAHEGNSFLDGGRHAWSKLIISENGRVDIRIRVDNRVALAGYCFRSKYFFRDLNGNILYRHGAPQYCVDGSIVPWGRSKREEHISFKLPKNVRADVVDVVVVHGPGSSDRFPSFIKAVAKGAAIFVLKDAPH